MYSLKIVLCKINVTELHKFGFLVVLINLTHVVGRRFLMGLIRKRNSPPEAVPGKAAVTKRSKTLWLEQERSLLLSNSAVQR